MRIAIDKSKTPVAGRSGGARGQNPPAASMALGQIWIHTQRVSIAIILHEATHGDLIAMAAMEKITEGAQAHVVGASRRRNDGLARIHDLKMMERFGEGDLPQAGGAA